MTENELRELKYILKSIKSIPQNTTFLEVIDKIYDENIVSNWLGFLLNPKINGIGNKIAEILLESVEYNEEIEFGDFIEIRREKSTIDKKRMDLVIEYSNIWIVLENKICSTEHDNQTVHYYNYIEKERLENNINKVVYIYLRPDWNNPLDKNIPNKKYCENENGFRNLFFSALISKMKEINYFNYKEKEKFIYLKGIHREWREVLYGR